MSIAHCIFLVGSRASGKSTVGKALAGQLGWAFVDTDALVVERAGRDIATIVREEGWDGFRKRESEALAVAALRDFAVIATGGGMVLLSANRELMRKAGIVFYLQLPAEELVRRLEAEPLHGQRPPLTEGSPQTEGSLHEQVLPPTNATPPGRASDEEQHCLTVCAAEDSRLSSTVCAPTGCALVDEVAQVLALRTPLYGEAAHHVLDGTRSVSELVSNIERLLAFRDDATTDF